MECWCANVGYHRQSELFGQFVVFPSVITVHNNDINNTELLQKVPEN